MHYLDKFVGWRLARIALLLQSLPALPLCLKLLKPPGCFFQSYNTPTIVQEFFFSTLMKAELATEMY